MKTLVLFSILIICSHFIFAQNGVVSPQGIGFPNHTSGSRPAANSVGIGTVIYNTSDNTHQFSNGSSWLNLLGTTALPAGAAWQTLRNNGSGWVVDNNITNDGVHTRIGSNLFGDIALAVGYGTQHSAIYAMGDYFGVLGESSNTAGTGVKGYSSNIGVFGESIGADGMGVKGTSPSGYGLYGYSNTGNGVFGISNYGAGLSGESAFGYAGKFKGSVFVGTSGITVPTSPLAPLHVSGTNTLSSNGYTAYWFGAIYGTGTLINSTSSGSWATGLLVDYDIVGKRSIVSAQAITTSDARIKNIIGLSNNQQDLELLKKIEITDYRYKDIVNWGSQTFKKVIAQQVEEVYPQAVRKQTSTIPDIYSFSEKAVFDEVNKKLTISLPKNYDIKIGEKIELIDEKNNRQLAEVESADTKSFTVKNWQYSTDRIFVFGREVSDFRAVDYEAISMLGISAMQQLAKENEELKLKVKQLESNFAARIEVLEAMVLKPH